MRLTAGLLAAVVLSPLYTASLRADVLILTDGSRVEGDVKRDGDNWLVTAAGNTRTIAAGRVKGIELGSSGANSPEDATRKLTALRQTAANQSDIHQILDNYKRFLEVVSDPAATAAAKKDMADWQAKLDGGLTKVGPKWVTASERDQLAQSAQTDAETARQLLKQGRAKEAEPLVQKALTNDPTNPSALYLRGLLSFNQDRFPAARDVFLSVANAVPNHAPTLNNLGVTFWRLKQYPQAMLNYDAAMAASPMNKQVLDNVAAAIHALPDSAQSNVSVQRAVRRFKEQDKVLAEQMSHDGWHRWGNTWVSDEQWKQIEAQRKETQAKLDAYATDFDTAKKQLAETDANLLRTAQSLRRLEAESYYSDATGKTIQIALPPLYFDMQTDYQRLQQERTARAKKLDALQETAKTLQKKLPEPTYSDVQTVIGPEGTPLRPPVALSDTPATQPATQPMQALGM